MSDDIVALAHVDVHYLGVLTSIADLDAVVPPCYNEADSTAVCSVVVCTLREDDRRKSSRSKWHPFLKAELSR